MKNLLNLKGAQKLSKNELTNIHGGGDEPHALLCDSSCPYQGKKCFYQGHCGCPGRCGYDLGSLTCIPY